MECPRDRGRLGEIRVDEVVLDRCEHCSGIWLDFVQLERVLSRESRSLRKLLPEGRTALPEDYREEETLACPRCSGTLLRMSASPQPFIYYGCLTCYGRWLDGTELDRIAGRPLAAKFEQLFRELLE